MKSNYWLLFVVFALIALPGKIVRTFNTPKATGKIGGMKSTYRLDFSDFTEPGTYYLKAGKAISHRFPINTHVHNGYIYHPTKTGEHIDVPGGWHDATDYLQYTTTSANAIYQMMFAFQENPESFGDAYDAAYQEGMKQGYIKDDKNVYVNGGIIRTDPSKKQITLVFTAADKADGTDAIISTLKKHGIKGGFFFTGEFFELYPEAVKRLLNEGHYVGSHSFGHLLYMPWENRDSLLVTREEFEQDMLKSYETLRKAGIAYKDAPVYIPPYEYYNKEISAWAKSMGIQVINYTPGTMSNADYTTPDMGPKYRSSQFIYDKIMEVEKKEGLNGHLMLIHFGTDDRRTDKFYNGHLDKMIKTLKRKGYTFVPLREAVGI